MSRRPSVIIVGGGFGGLSAAQALKSAPVDVTLIDQHNYPEASGRLTPANHDRSSTRAGAELVYRHAVKLLPRLQLSRGKAGVVGRVREMLRF